MEHHATQDRGVNEAERFRTLLEINNAIVSSLTREALFHAIARALRRVLPFDRMAIFLHDAQRDVLQLFILESTLPLGRYAVGLEWAIGESHAGWAFQHQQPLVRQDLGRERQYPTEDLLYADGVKSVLVVPLIARGKSIGTLNLNSATPSRYADSDARFLQEVAGQVALAVENMKAYEEITALSTKASEAAERQRTLLEINNAIISNLTQEALFRAVAQALRRVMSFERTAIFLHDPAPNVLRLFVLDSSLASDYFVVGLEMPPGDSHVGLVFREKRSLLRRDLATERQYPMEDRAYADGVRSYIIVPLLVRGDPIGTLAVASTAANQYTEADVAFLQEVASQVALAVENMKAYEKIAALHGKAVAEAAQRRLAEELLREIAGGTASVTGSDFFASLVRHLSSALAVRYAFVAESLNRAKTQARTLAFWAGDALGEPFEFFVAGTPCSGVLEGAVCCYPSRVRELFPEDQDLVRLGAESYLGVPILDATGQVIGHMGVLNDRPIQEDSRHVGVMRIFAARAGAELERLRAEEGLRRALAEVEALKNRLHAENVYLQEEIRTAHDFVEMVGNSPALLEVLRKVEKVAPTDSTVLISGETGTGKELIARAIHDRSPRKSRPLVKVNCSAISAGLVESELFGHVKGAFTGALERRVGRFELADGGTIFLDEVGELPPETQVKLLRVLQEQEFEPVGSSRPLRVDVRLIAATNRNLEDAIQAGRFRSDLFYRLNVFPLDVPPLRARRSDIPQLVMFFLQRFSKKFGKRIETVSPSTMDLLESYAWPGNVRELQNIIERAVVLSAGPALDLSPGLLPVSVSGGQPGPVEGPEAPAAAAVREEAPGHPPSGPGPARIATLEDMERAHILAALRQTGGVIEGPKGAGKILGIHPNTLRSRMQRLGIKRAGHDIS